MAAISTSEMTTRTAVLAGEDFLAAPCPTSPPAACSLIAAPPAAPASTQASPCPRLGARGRLAWPASRRTGEITRAVASAHGPLDAPRPAAAGAGVPLRGPVQ